MSVTTEGDIIRKALFVPCPTKEALHTWIQFYLGLNMPDTIVDPDSNCSPMDMIWELYRKALENNDENFSRVMAYASRDSMKTLGAAVLEVLAVVHLDRDVAHMAAIKPQAEKAQSYVKKMFRFPYLRDYVVSSNNSKTEVVWYTHEETGDPLTKEQYSALTDAEKALHKEHARYVKIVICTMQGANSEHVPFFVVDEVDVVPKQNQPAYQEAKSIPAMFEGKEPITLLTSTRKFAFGNVQRELDKADKTGLVVRHWNIIDVTERCPPTRHLPEEPRIPIWVRPDEFSAISQDEYELLPPEKQVKYQGDTGYSGCLKKCKLFAMCRGNLATKQKDHPRDAKGQFIEVPMPLLKSIRFTTNKFKELSPDMARAQLMCWQASREGLIYPKLDRERHLLSPAKIAEKLLGQPHPANFTFGQLVELLRTREGRFVAGVDFGFTHNFAVVLLFIDHGRAFVLGSWGQPELDPTEKLALLERTIKPYDPELYCDTEQPDMIKFFKKNGYRTRDWSKGPGSVLGGIETVRYKLSPPLQEPQLFFVDSAPGINRLVDELSLYHWCLDDNGDPNNEPDEIIGEDDEGNKIIDDSCDAFRYAVMNVFKNKGGGVVAAPEQHQLPSVKQVQTFQQQYDQQQREYFKQLIGHAGIQDWTGGTQNSGDDDEPDSKAGRKGSFFWDM